MREASLHTLIAKEIGARTGAPKVGDVAPRTLGAKEARIMTRASKVEGWPSELPIARGEEVLVVLTRFSRVVERMTTILLPVEGREMG